MLIDKQTRMNRRQTDRDDRKGYLQDRDDLLSMKYDKIQRRYDEIEKNMSALQEKRAELMESPLTKSEYGELIKQKFRSTRASVLGKVTEYVKERQKANYEAFALDDKHIFKDYQWHMLLWLALSEKDIDQIIERLPELGCITASERDAQIAELDSQIEQLKNDLKKELEAEKSSR